MFLVAGVITAMGALFHVNAIWLYGPYDVGAATSYSQPDWYIGFLEGSLRLMPPWEIRIGSFMINNLVFSAMLVPGVIFTGLLLVPWIERHFTKDDRQHHLLDRRAPPPHRRRWCLDGLRRRAVLVAPRHHRHDAVGLDHVRPCCRSPCWSCRSSTSRRTGSAGVADPAGPDRTERAGVIMRDPGGGYHGRPSRRKRGRAGHIGRGGE
jgi:ubiquinol-cytochrome c reductase cytochrome b subunit